MNCDENQEEEFKDGSPTKISYHREIDHIVNYVKKVQEEQA